MAKFLDITPRWLRVLKSEGILIGAKDENGDELRGRYELLPNFQAYVRYLRQQARIDDASENKWQIARNRRAEAEAERIELELKLYKGQLHRAEDVEFILTTRITAAKTRILAIAARVSRLVLGKTEFKEVYNLIYAECESALNEVSGINSKAFTQQIIAYLQSVSESSNKPNGNKK